MKIFNQQPNYKQSFAKGIRGAPGIVLISHQMGIMIC